MAISSADTIEVKQICDKKSRTYELYVDGQRRATVQIYKNGNTSFRFYPIGKFQLDEAKNWLIGLIHLFAEAEDSSHG